MANRIEIETSSLNSDTERISGEIAKIEEELQQLREETERLSSMWEGPACAAYQSRIGAEMEHAALICKQFAEYVSCMEYASREYVKCETAAESMASLIWI